MAGRLINPADYGRGIRTVLFGDSLTFLSNQIEPGMSLAYDATLGTSYYTGTGVASTTDYGAFSWADALMGAPHYVIRNSGIGGNNTDQMLARITTDVLQYNPELVYLWGGRNDFKQGKDAPYVIARMTQMLDAITAIGAAICLIDVPPSTDLNLTASGSRNAIVFSEWLRDEVRKRKGCFLVSALGVMADPLYTNSAAAKSTYVVADGIHNNNLGAFRVGGEIARVMGPHVKPWAHYPKSPVEGYDFQPNTAPEYRNSNPLFAGSGGTAGTGVTGTVAAGWEVGRSSGTPTVVASVVEEAEFVGNAQRLAITFTGAADEAVYLGILTGSIHSRFVDGKVMELQADIRIASGSADIINRMELVSSGTFNGQSVQSRAMARVVSSSVQGLADNVQPMPLAGRFLRARTPRVLAAGPCTVWNHFLRIYSSTAGTVTVDVSRYGVRQFTPQ